MPALEDLRVGATIRGISPDGAVTIEKVEWYGDQAVEVLYRDSSGGVRNRLVYRTDEPTLELVTAGRAWSFDGDADLFRLVAEAYRIRLAHLFDPYLAISTSEVDALPHQISAVYGEMLPRQPLRFLLADDPGAGKTIMAGLLIKELMVRGDLQRCLIISPGSLTEQWQDELYDKFGLSFSILSRDMVEAARTGNPFADHPLLIARLDQLSRNEELQQRLLAAPEWDLIVVDEAHKMSASYFGSEVKFTGRYKLGQTVGGHCRNFLLMTATPHNGKEQDFQLFMALIDADRFEGKFREDVHAADASDLMRRLVKEELLTFEGKPLFPERRAYTVNYKLSDGEAKLYAEVTTYVREEMNRVDRLGEKEGRRKVTVGFALQTLQRRLASSPEAIYRSLCRRREKLEIRLQEERVLARGGAINRKTEEPDLSEAEIEDLEDAPEAEIEETEDLVVNQATAAQTIAELEAELVTLRRLEGLAKTVRHSGSDAKWKQLGSILDDERMFDEQRRRRKLVVFTESRDTLNYLVERIVERLGRTEAVVQIHGGVSREARRDAVSKFMNDPEVLVLVANDAAGEGVNLQRAHLMVNYDLPWNPNRLEQRFGRIHRIKQKDVCHLWNLVAGETREGEVYKALLEKLETERDALGDRVYNVLGQLFEEKALRDLLIEAVRYGDDPKVKARLDQTVGTVADRQRILSLLDARALVKDTMDASQVATIREELERAQARRLQPHFIQSFFVGAFERLGGKVHPRENGRWEVTHVPAAVRERDRQLGKADKVQPRYERIAFEKGKIHEPPVAAFLCPGHPLLDSSIAVVLERHKELLKRGAVLIDDNDLGTEPRILFFLESVVQDGRRGPGGHFHVVSQRLEFVEVTESGVFRNAGYAPYLDYRPALAAERDLVKPIISAAWIQPELESKAMGYAITSLVREHVKEVSDRRHRLLDKVETEVKARLKKEITYWDRRSEELKLQERAGKKVRLSAANAAARAEALSGRLQARLEQLKAERNIMAQPPVVVGGAIVLPVGLLKKLRGEPQPAGMDKDLVERMAMEAVMAVERRLGREPRDVSKNRGLGYDIESKDQAKIGLVFVEVKGREETADSVSLTRNEIICALNEPEKFRLAIVTVGPGGAAEPVYVQGYDFGQPGFEQTSATYPLAGLLRRGGKPS